MKWCSAGLSQANEMRFVLPAIWRAADRIGIFAKFVLAFFYEPADDAQSHRCANEWKKELNCTWRMLIIRLFLCAFCRARNVNVNLNGAQLGENKRPQKYDQANAASVKLWGKLHTSKQHRLINLGGTGMCAIDCITLCTHRNHSNRYCKYEESEQRKHKQKQQQPMSIRPTEKRKKQHKTHNLACAEQQTQMMCI